MSLFSDLRLEHRNCLRQPLRGQSLANVVYVGCRYSFIGATIIVAAQIRTRIGLGVGPLPCFCLSCLFPCRVPVAVATVLGVAGAAISWLLDMVVVIIGLV